MTHAITHEVTEDEAVALRALAVKMVENCDDYVHSYGQKLTDLLRLIGIVE